jgi:hypothetical protein
MDTTTNNTPTFLLVVLAFLLGLMTAAALSPEAAKIFHVYEALASLGIHPRIVPPPTVAADGTIQSSLPKEICVAGSEDGTNCTAHPNGNHSQPIAADQAVKRAQPQIAGSENPTAHDVLHEIEAMDKSHPQTRPEKPTISSSQPAILSGSGGIDPKSEERIMQMAIPGDLKKEILLRYRRTGVLPPQLQH